MCEKVQSLKPIAFSSQLLAHSFYCGEGVGGWWYKLCTTTAFYTHTYMQQLAVWVQNGIYAQFVRFCSAILSTYLNKLFSLFFIIYTPFPQALLLKQLSK